MLQPTQAFLLQLHRIREAEGAKTALKQYRTKLVKMVQLHAHKKGGCRVGDIECDCELCKDHDEKILAGQEIDRNKATVVESFLPVLDSFLTRYGFSFSNPRTHLFFF